MMVRFLSHGQDWDGECHVLIPEEFMGKTDRLGWIPGSVEIISIIPREPGELKVWWDTWGKGVNELGLVQYNTSAPIIY